MVRSLLAVFALAAASSLVAADDVYTFPNAGCCGRAYYFKDAKPQTCFVGTGGLNNITEAIAENLTKVKAGLLINTNTTIDKTFIAWDQGPDSNNDGPLQCGSLAFQKLSNSDSKRVCIDGGDYHTYRGFSWVYSTQPASAGKRSEPEGTQQGGPLPGGATQPDWTKCTGSQSPYGVMLGGKKFAVPYDKPQDAIKLLLLVTTLDDVPDHLNQYVI